MLLVGQKLRFGISKHCCRFVRFLSTNQSQICWIVPRHISRPQHEEPLLVINLKNIHKMIPGQVSRVCSLILQLTPVSPAVLRNCCLWVTCIRERQPANTCPKLSTVKLSGPWNWVDLTWIGLGLGLEPEGTMGYIWFSDWFGFSHFLVNIKNELNCSMWVYIWI